jgi:hypothetical protein
MFDCVKKTQNVRVVANPGPSRNFFEDLFKLWIIDYFECTLFLALLAVPLTK